MPNFVHIFFALVIVMVHFDAHFHISTVYISGGFFREFGNFIHDFFFALVIFMVCFIAHFHFAYSLLFFLQKLLTMTFAYNLR